MKPKRTKRLTPFFLKLECEYCGKIFRTERFKKYCSKDCSKQANRVRTGFRYKEMRAAYYKIRDLGGHKKLKAK